MSIAGISAYEIQSIFGVSGARQTPLPPRATQNKTSSGDTVEFSSEAQMLANLTMHNKVTSFGDDSWSGQLKLLDDPTLNLAVDRVFMPDVLESKMPKLFGERLSSLLDAERNKQGLTSNAERAYLQQNMMKKEQEHADAGKSVHLYKAAMRRAGVDPGDPAALLELSRDPAKLKVIEDIFLASL